MRFVSEIPVNDPVVASWGYRCIGNLSGCDLFVELMIVFVEIYIVEYIVYSPRLVSFFLSVVYKT